MALRKGVFTSSVFLTAKLGGIDRYARIGTYHICNGVVPGETFVSSAENISTLEKFERGYRISGSGKWFQLPESRLRINIESLFRDGRLISEVDRRSVNPRVKMDNMQVGGDNGNFNALIGSITTSDDTNSFGEMNVIRPHFDKSKKKAGGRARQNGGDKSKGTSNGNRNSTASQNPSQTGDGKAKISQSKPRSHESKGGAAQTELASPIINGSPLSVIQRAESETVKPEEEKGLPKATGVIRKTASVTTATLQSLEDLIQNSAGFLKSYKLDTFDLTTVSYEAEWPTVSTDRVIKFELRDGQMLDYVVKMTSPMRLYRVNRVLEPENMDVYTADRYTFILLKG